MAEFHVSDETPTGVREITFRSVRAMQRSPHSSEDYRLEKDQIRRELLLVEQVLSELDLSLDEIFEIIIDGDVIAVVHDQDVTADANYTGTIGDTGIEYIVLPGTKALVSDLQNLSRRVVALEQGR